MSRPPAHPDLERWRADTPGCERLLHLNNAGAALTPAPVRGAVAEHLALESELGGYEAAEARAERLAAASTSLARLLATHPRNLALAQNSTVAFAQALAALDLGPGDLILTSRADYASNQIMYLALARRRGVRVERVPDAPEGGIDPAELGSLVARRRPALVGLTWVPTNSGLVQPVEAVGEICRAREIPYLVDACQAIGQMPVDVGRIGCDYLAGTARKFLRGPRGIGFLYVADRMLVAGAYPLSVDMHGASWTGSEEFTLTPDARRFESWEISCALALGLGAAAEYALGVGLETAQARARALAAYARQRLAALPLVRILDRGPELCAIVSAVPGSRDSAALKLALRARGINTSSPGREDALLDMDAKGAGSALRFSPHYYNTSEEIDRAVEALEEEMRV